MIAENRRSLSIFCSLSFLLLILSFMSIHDAGGAPAMEKKPKMYQLMWEADNVLGDIAINGFVVTALDGSFGNGSASLNPWLTGENELTVVR